MALSSGCRKRLDTAPSGCPQDLAPRPAAVYRGRMDNLIWIGAAVTLLGLAGLVLCILKVARAKRQGLDDAALKAELQKVVAFNLGALLLSAIGLMMVVLGILLG